MKNSLKTHHIALEGEISVTDPKGEDSKNRDVGNDKSNKTDNSNQSGYSS